MSALRHSLLALGALSATLLCAQEPEAQPAAPPPPPPSVEVDRDAGEASLVRAYQKEFAFLANEERALSERLSELAADRTARLEREDAALDALEAQLRAEQTRVESVRAELTELDDQLLSLDEGGDSVLALRSQIEATRARFSRPALADDAGNPAQAIAGIVRGLKDVDALLTELSTVRVAPGQFYLPDGTATEAELLHVGAIATLGAGKDSAGTLAPAGDGELMLWPVETGAAARAALAGPLPDVLPLYLYETADKLAEQPHEKTLAELVEKGGVVGYVIVGLGALAGLLVVLRLILLGLAASNPDRLIAETTADVRSGNTERAVRAAKAQRNCAARVLAAMLPHLKASPDQLESAASGAILRETLRVERFDTAILVSAAVAPLLGLLGTVTGMISTFDVITVFGTGDPKLLSGGISEALITTQLGLSVAIPTLLAGNLVSGWAEQIRSGMERTALQAALLAAEVREALAAKAPASAEPEAEAEAEAPVAVTPPVGTQSVGLATGARVSAQLPTSQRRVTPTATTASEVAPLPTPAAEVAPDRTPQ